MTEEGVRLLSRRRGAVAGAVTVAAALAAGELVAAITGVTETPLLAVGSQFVDRFAASLKELAVALFGTNDKAALVIGTVAVTLVLGAVAGGIARRAAWLVPALVLVLSVVGFASQVADPRGSVPLALLGAVVANGVGFGTWRLLTRAAPRRGDNQAAAPPSRRDFLTVSGIAATAAAGTAALSRLVAGATGGASSMPDGIVLPEPPSTVPLPDTAAFDAEGISPYVTASEDFYRIDTALSVPRVDVGTWRLRIEGLVEQPIEIDYEQLLAMPSVEQPVTLQCVSNQVGGDLVDNAVWQGVPLLDLLAQAGVQASAEQLFSTSVDGWSCGFPVSVLDGERTALVAYAMNGEPLLPEHGFPVRLVVAGLYGYVSATKWLETIELTTWDERDGYWVPRGWAKEGPIKLASRIDVPAQGAQIDADTVIGGVAWLPGTGVRTVEIQVDDGPWQECELASVADGNTWVQWRLPVTGLAPGRHRATVRAVDAEGNRQSVDVRPPAPDGASGLHRREFEVVG
ncbi:molybdopterin-dependent oxidoreductase [Pseudactinotalea suaedae]|uniref:molybdopterin-dependent oxidoreductase n=1 Tax=Pseudactinotalea suaedae TaxID=1524924 RepID=UPI001390CA83|nr:molybdopterin-dependent oxidoreductase [Pseudactinotalea suaedae]